MPGKDNERGTVDWQGLPPGIGLYKPFPSDTHRAPVHDVAARMHRGPDVGNRVRLRRRSLADGGEYLVEFGKELAGVLLSED